MRSRTLASLSGPAALAVALLVAAACSEPEATGLTPPPVESTERSLPTTAPHQAGVDLGHGLVTTTIGERCVDCHEDIVTAYRSSGMHDALTLPTGEGSIEAGLVGRRVVDPGSGITVVFDARDGKYVQRITYVDPRGVERAAFEARVDLVVGSGHNTRSYFQVTEGRFLQLPLTWYYELGDLALSPGPGFTQRAMRLGQNLCVGCHTGTVNPVDTAWGAGFTGELSLGVTCERCHGPSDDHVVSGDPRTTVNPARLPADRQEMVCQQCHLSAGLTIEASDRTIADYVPGEDLAEWLGIFEAEGSLTKEHADIAGHGERIRLSRCHTATEAAGDQLACTTCHNPHRGFKADTTTQETDLGCLVCHDTDACHGDEEERAGQACFSCHMAVTPAGDIAHAKVTDHWIRRTLPPARPSARHLAHPGELAASDVKLRNVLDPVPERENAIVLTARAYATGAETAHMVFGEGGEGWRRRAYALAGAQLARHPGDADALLVRGKMLTLGGDPDAARDLLAKARDARPSDPGTHAALGLAAAEREEFAAADRHLAAAGKLDPFDESIAMAHARVLVELERRSQALAVLAAIRTRLGPSSDRAFLASEIASRGRDTEAALAHAFDVVLFSPFAPDVQTRIGDLLAVLGETERARLHLYEALRLDPNFEVARTMLDRLASDDE